MYVRISYKLYLTDYDLNCSWIQPTKVMMPPISQKIQTPVTSERKFFKWKRPFALSKELEHTGVFHMPTFVYSLVFIIQKSSKLLTSKSMMG